jgi:hypothetical protein
MNPVQTFRPYTIKSMLKFCLVCAKPSSRSPFVKFRNKQFVSTLGAVISRPIPRCEGRILRLHETAFQFIRSSPPYYLRCLLHPRRGVQMDPLNVQQSNTIWNLLGAFHSTALRIILSLSLIVTASSQPQSIAAGA